eukprot:gnl/TRDRNA2_/TRDRNA2_175033_c2_seq3.p1 gnl/TRDRNA2_/TRDRNA2_175033_c2~~gnl/TRDRNA2_/TRDRNA2_175033_c2_seq3.p1  ORF type:complete len:424 (-),score=45.49 gnl/TRDRNA2_/TRDRNA2_175033_c2_seq3:239-1510(-)
MEDIEDDYLRIPLNGMVSQLMISYGCCRKLWLLIGMSCLVFPSIIGIGGGRPTSALLTDRDDAASGPRTHFHLARPRLEEAAQSGKEETSLVDNLADRRLVKQRLHGEKLDATLFGKRVPFTRRRAKKARATAALSSTAALSATGTLTAEGSQGGSSGDAQIKGAAAATASLVQSSVMVPISSVQTRMQANGLGFAPTLRALLAGGALQGLQKLCSAIPSTIAIVSMASAITYSGSAVMKNKLPAEWPEAAREAISIGLSAGVGAALTFPVDTVKTRLQLGGALPKMCELYRGFTPQIQKEVVGTVVWLLTRQCLEHRVPEPQDPVLQQWKHCFCGGLAGIAATSAVFPFDTVKKRLQASAQKPKMLKEARALFKEGGLPRFYRGVELKLPTTFASGALFNSIFTACSTLLEAKQRLIGQAHA